MRALLLLSLLLLAACVQSGDLYLPPEEPAPVESAPPAEPVPAGHPPEEEKPEGKK